MAQPECNFEEPADTDENSAFRSSREDRQLRAEEAANEVAAQAEAAGMPPTAVDRMASAEYERVMDGIEDSSEDSGEDWGEDVSEE